MRLEINAKSAPNSNIYIPDKKIRGHFPDFLILGPQRTGTTWLSENLRKHPEILISYPKELYFLNRLEPNQQTFYQERYMHSLKTRNIPHIIKTFLKHIYIDLICTKHYPKNDIRWYLSFFRISLPRFLFKSFRFRRWYTPTVRGESTASTININEKIIEEITAINPQLKCIIIVRDPISRAWSHAKKKLFRDSHKKSNQVPEEEVQHFLQEAYQIACGNYCKNIDKWQKHLKQNHLLLLSFDQLNKEPSVILNQVLNFLKVRPALHYFGKNLNKKRNTTEKLTISTDCKAILDTLYSKEIKQLQDRYGFDFRREIQKRPL